MNSEFEFVSLRNILARVARHPLIQDIDLEAGIQYVLDFFAIVGVPQIFEDRQDVIDICDFKGTLPCDIVQIIQVREERSKLPLRSMTDSFNGNSREIPAGATFKTQNRTIFTSFPQGKVRVSYKAIKTDADGIPMLPDDRVFMQALEAYIKLEVFTAKFDEGKMDARIFDHAERDYYFKVGKAINRFKMPSYAEMQTITGMMHRMILSTREFEAGFKGLGDTEHFRTH